jgi:hypothetical protein
VAREAQIDVNELHADLLKRRVAAVSGRDDPGDRALIGAADVGPGNEPSSVTT